MTTAKTHANYGDQTNMVQQAVGLFATHMQRNSTMARLTGKMPKGEAGAEATLRKQTTQHMPIVTCQDLGKGEGDEVTFHLLNPVNAKPIMGSEYAEGKGVGMKLSEDKLRVNQARFPVSLGDVMTDIRSPADFRRLGRPVAQNLMDRYVDQSLLVHMAGARGYHDNVEWVVPTTADADFAKIMVNPVKAPTKNRHYLADATDGVKQFALSGADVDLGTTDVFSLDTVDAMRTVMDQMVLPPPIVKLDGDEMAEDSPLRVWLLSPAQYNLFAKSSSFRNFQASAFARASRAKQHPLFLGEAGLWNSFLLMKMPRPIRWYQGQGNVMKYCASATSETESDATIAAGLGTGFAIDRSIILGGQAVAQALAASRHSGIPFFWKEKLLDHDDKAELLIGAVRGVSKVRFDVETGEGTHEYTDYGITVVDTVVPRVAGQ
jgi:N4-gp56 family major capsid protein